MRATNKTVIETLVAIDAQTVPGWRLRGIKPAAIKFCFAEGLINDYSGFGVLLTAKGVEAIRAAQPNWQPVSRAKALAELRASKAA